MYCPSYTKIHTWSRIYRLEAISPIFLSNLFFSPLSSHPTPLTPGPLFCPCSFLPVIFYLNFEQVRKYINKTGNSGYLFMSYHSSGLVKTTPLLLTGLLNVAQPTLTWHTASLQLLNATSTMSLNTLVISLFPSFHLFIYHLVGLASAFMLYKQLSLMFSMKQLLKIISRLLLWPHHHNYSK